MCVSLIRSTAINEAFNPFHQTQPPTQTNQKNRYRLDGRLAKATRIKGIQDFNARDYGLVEIPVSLWGGHLVFLHLNRVGKQASSQGPGAAAAAASSASSSSAALAHLDPLLQRLEAEHGSFGDGAMRHVARRTYRLNCNWKVGGHWYCLSPSSFVLER